MLAIAVQKQESLVEILYVVFSFYIISTKVCKSREIVIR
jgi:hypothetical protein